MRVHCRHDPNKQLTSSPHNEFNTGYTHILDASYRPEKHFEPWTMPNSSKDQSLYQNNVILNESKFKEPPKTSNFVRNYGWDEIEQNEQETERLHQLLSIWNAERIAILKLQYDLDKSIFKRTFEYLKRLGQSIGLALWLWIHRSMNYSNTSYVNQCEEHQSQNLTGLQSYHLSRNRLLDSIWHRLSLSNEPKEDLPPIARAMKSMLDNNMFILNSENRDENLWPHFINQYRMTQNKTSFGNVNDDIQAASLLKHTNNESEPNQEVIKTVPKLDIRTEQHPLKEIDTLVQSDIFHSSPLKDKQHPLKQATESFQRQKIEVKKLQRHRKKTPRSKSEDKVHRRSKSQRRKTKHRKSSKRSKSNKNKTLH